MGYLDNLENNLKALESREERDPAEALKRHQEREAARAQAIAAAPMAEALKKSPFAMELLDHCARLGHQLRAVVAPSWEGSKLRVSARNLRMDLEPTAAGVVVHFFRDGGETGAAPVSLDSSPSDLAEKFLSPLRNP